MGCFSLQKGATRGKEGTGGTVFLLALLLVPELKKRVQQNFPKVGLTRLIWAEEQEIFLFPLLGEWLVCFFTFRKATSVQEKKVFLNADRLLHHPMASVAGNLRKENTECNKVSDEYAIAEVQETS